KSGPNACQLFYSRRTNSSSDIAVIDEKNRRIEVRNKGLRSLPSLVIQYRNGLEHLNLDGNLLTENAFNMPVFPRLKSLSLQRNKARISYGILSALRLFIDHLASLASLIRGGKEGGIRNISRLLECLRECCPRLESIVLVGNPGWPLAQCGFIDKQYSMFRMHTESYLRSLRYIDSLPTNRELCDTGVIADSNRNKRPSIQKENSEDVVDVESTSLSDLCTDPIIYDKLEN
ncbi:hypothetical protein PRIPAC_82852, partial [Pristionchus pacificus]|uniref:Uncharacterized protein n=1 Tax=Pristionchus pacificus TaxID=54126 RepID=A0A2A6CQS3_PRIPA